MSALAASDRLLLLRRSALFAQISEDALRELAPAVRERRAEAGTLLVRKGEPGDCMMIVVSGCVKITSVSPRGNELLLNIVHPGQIFGELALLDGRERCADAIAVSDTHLLVVPRQAFADFLHRNPHLAIPMMRVLCGRIRKTTALAEDTVFLQLPMRLFRRIQDLAEAFGRRADGGIQVQHGLSQQALADSVGASRESVNRLLNEWQQRGLITVGRGVITVGDVSALASAASLREG